MLFDNNKLLTSTFFSSLKLVARLSIFFCFEISLRRSNNILLTFVIFLYFFQLSILCYSMIVIIKILELQNIS